MENLSVRRDFLLFLRNPNYNKFNTISEKEKLVVVLKVFLLTILGLIIVNTPLTILKKVGIISSVMMKTVLFIRSIPSSHSDLKTYLLIHTIFLVPILEESVFRLCLTKFKVRYFIASVSILTGIVIVMFVKSQLWVPKSDFLMSEIGLAYILFFALIAVGFMWPFRKRLKKLKNIWNKNAGVGVYFISILFALSHLNNLKFEPSDWFFMPLILAPFFIYGLSFSYLRVRLGIWYSILLHFTINLIASVGLLQLLHR
jgi:membrane protease YdiL (CAAX protease family)